MRTIIRFTLKLQHRNGGNCLKDNGEMESCSVKATDILVYASWGYWGYFVINWDSQSCSRDIGKQDRTDHISYLCINVYKYCLLTCELNTLYLQAAMLAG